MCGSDLTHEVQCMGDKCIHTYYCANHGFRALNKKMSDYIEVYHYSHREFSNKDDGYVTGNLSEIICSPYMIKHWKQNKRSRVYFLPVGDKSAQFIAEVPLLDIDWTDAEEITKKLKMIILMS
jgi:hypothetical protein